MGEMIPPVVVQVKPETKDIFAFKMYHSFWSFLGVMRILVSAAFLVTAILSVGRFETLLTVVLFAFGLLNPVITPVLFWIQADSEAKRCITTTFTFTSQKIFANDGKKKAEIHWDDLALTVWLKRELFLYTTPAQALILPKRQMKDEADVLLEIVKASATPNRIVIREWL